MTDPTAKYNANTKSDPSTSHVNSETATATNLTFAQALEQTVDEAEVCPDYSDILVFSAQMEYIDQYLCSGTKR